MDGAAVPPVLVTFREKNESDEEARARALAPYSPKDLAKIVVVCLDQEDAEL